MNNETIWIIIFGILGLFFSRLGFLEIKTGIASAQFGGFIGPITRDGAPLWYWFSVIGKFIVSVLMLTLILGLLFNNKDANQSLQPAVKTLVELGNEQGAINFIHKV